MRQFAIVLVALVACGHGASFRPYKVEYAHLLPMVRSAALAYSGDVDALTAAGALLIGVVHVRSDQEAQVRGAKAGGTHVYLVRSETESFPVGQRCLSRTTDAPGGPVTSTACSNVTRTVQRNDYAVLRLPEWRERLNPLPWPDALPLREEGAALARPPAKPRCRPLPEFDDGCEYTHYRGFMQYDEERVYVMCEDNRPVRDITSEIPRGSCRVKGNNDR